MSVKKLENMIKKLNLAEKENKHSAKGGFAGIGHDPRTPLSKAGGNRTGGKCKLCNEMDHGTKEHKCARCGIVGNHRARNCTGGMMTGGILTGGKHHKTNKASKGCTCTKMCKCNVGGILTGGHIDSFDGIGGILTGGVLTGGNIDGFDGVTGGRKKRASSHHAKAGILTGGEIDNFMGTVGGMRMRSDLRTYNSATTQRGVSRGRKAAINPLPYGYNASDVSGGKKRSHSAPSQLNEWRAHLNAFKVKHPHLSFKECMKEASKTYKKH